MLASNESSTLRWRGDFGDVYRNLCRADANGKTVDETANDQHANILRCRDDDRANNPAFPSAIVNCYSLIRNSPDD